MAMDHSLFGHGNRHCIYFPFWPREIFEISSNASYQIDDFPVPKPSTNFPKFSWFLEVNELMLTMLFRQYPGFQEAGWIERWEWL